MQKDALIVFVKAPIKGRVKTRLSPYLSDDQILRLYKSFLNMITMRCSRLKDVDRFLGCTPSKEDGFLLNLAKGYGYRCFEQKGNNLGERIINAFKEHLDMGYKKVVIIGSDSPTIPLEYIRMAFRSLEEMDLVIGPCNDGGYYLVGAKRLYDSPFKGIPWDTSDVLNKTLDKLNSMGVNYFLLPFWYDIDRIEDLRFYKRHLKYLRVMGEEEYRLKAIGLRLKNIKPL
ncbi:MAG: TIGR04282 family arsenosugar biosynthesis glycosyltransferase [Thermodesulfovibrionia bacterium]